MTNRPRLPMRGIATQVMRSGSVGCASTRIVGAGHEAAQLQLAKSMIEQRRKRKVAIAYSSDVKGLLDGKLAIGIRAYLTQRAELQLAGNDTESLEPLLKVLSDIQGQASVPLVQELATKANSLVLQAVERLITGLDRCYIDHPESMPNIVDGIRKLVAEHEWLQNGADEIERFKLVAGNLRAFQKRRNAVIDETFRNAIACLWNRLRELHEKSLSILATDFINRSLRLELERLETFLAELRQKAIEYRERQTGLLSVLEQLRKRAADREPSRESTVFLALEGLRDREILTALNRQYRCKELSELAVQLAQPWEQTLRKLLPSVAPHVATDVSFPDMIRAFTARQLAKAYARTFDHALGAGVSLYDLLRKFGLGEAAQFLWDRAAPSCSQGGRAIAEFNVQLAHQTLVRLPALSGEKDKELREGLKTAFRSIGICQFLEARADQPLTVLRLTVGYPIGIDKHNVALLLSYQQAAASGHTPHLLGLLPTSPEGDACPEYLQLSSTGRSQ